MHSNRRHGGALASRIDLPGSAVHSAHSRAPYQAETIFSDRSSAVDHTSSMFRDCFRASPASDRT
jgi:hypothetical protein